MCSKLLNLSALFLCWFSAFEEYANRIATPDDWGYDLPSIIPKFIEPPTLCLTPC